MHHEFAHINLSMLMLVVFRFVLFHLHSVHEAAGHEKQKKLEMKFQSESKIEIEMLETKFFK